MKKEHGENFFLTDVNNRVIIAYLQNLPIDRDKILSDLENLPFQRVKYISRFGKINTTPRLTWAFSEMDKPETIHFRGLDFISEPMPIWLQNIADYLGKICKHNWNFDPKYNTCIIGKYLDGNDNISFHKDDETFLAHHFCANLTLLKGEPRDFHFRIEKDGKIELHQIALTDCSVLFFKLLEHSLPKRKHNNTIRYSLSFRKVKSSIGIGNIFYYSRGVNFAIDNDRKKEYLEKMAKI